MEIDEFINAGYAEIINQNAGSGNFQPAFLSGTALIILALGVLGIAAARGAWEIAAETDKSSIVDVPPVSLPSQIILKSKSEINPNQFRLDHPHLPWHYLNNTKPLPRRFCNAQPSLYRDTDFHQIQELGYGYMPTLDNVPYATGYNQSAKLLVAERSGCGGTEWDV